MDWREVGQRLLGWPLAVVGLIVGGLVVRWLLFRVIDRIVRRTEDGVLVRERVRGGVAKISASWAALSTADCAKVLNATAPDSMTVQYFFGGVRTAKMYAGDRTADLKAARDGQAVWEVAVNLIEF